MKTPFKFRIFIASLLLWIVANPTSAQQIRSLYEQFLHPSEEANPGRSGIGCMVPYQKKGLLPIWRL